MDALPKSRLLRFIERAMGLARRAVARFSTRSSRKRFTLCQRVVLFCLELKKATTYRDLVDHLIEMPRVRDAVDIDSVPAPSTLWTAFDRLEMVVWRVLLNVSPADLPLNGATGIDTSRSGRAHTSTHYAKRTNLTIQQSKTNSPCTASSRLSAGRGILGWIATSIIDGT